MKATVRLYLMRSGKVGPWGTGEPARLFRRPGCVVTPEEVEEHPELRAYVTDPPPRRRVTTKPVLPVESKPISAEGENKE